jgi:hypothetical protein
MPHLSVMRACAWLLGLHGVLTMVAAATWFYAAAASPGQHSEIALLAALLAGHILVFTLLQIVVGVRAADEDLRILRIDDTVANRLGSIYRLLVILVYIAIAVLLVLVYVPRFKANLAVPRLGQLVLTGSLTALSLLFIVCAVVGPSAIFHRRATRPPLLYRLRQNRLRQKHRLPK